tara:strand:+ start:368 stop:1108 length:741 start_codon:yes stop_codon:yes gene_type:complete
MTIPITSNGLNICCYQDEKYEIGVDEAGRGPLFGRVYTAAVILPKNLSFQHDLLKDSKRFSSEKKIDAVAKYIKENALAWVVLWNDEKQIDKLNIRQATLESMKNCVSEILKKDIDKDNINYRILVDGNDFKPYTIFNKYKNCIESIEHECIKKGDNTYTCIAAASILAKTERDSYIKDLCNKYPKIDQQYGILKNKGYGTKQHLEAIKNFGATPWHRRSYGICKTIHDNVDYDNLITGTDAISEK